MESKDLKSLVYNETYDLSKELTKQNARLEY